MGNEERFRAIAYSNAAKTLYNLTAPVDLLNHNIKKLDELKGVGESIAEKNQADLRIVKDNEYGAALLYFTGSKEHNILLRSIAKRKGMKINEYGVYDNSNNKRITGETEYSIYKILDLEYVQPELRLGKNELFKVEK